MIRYFDTRAFLSDPLPFRDVILQGIAPGGGLFVPERVPGLDLADILALEAMPYWQRAATVFERFELGLPADSTVDIARGAYGANFDHPDVAALRDVGASTFLLELWHGPTLAFKDMALQCMPLFFAEALEHAAAQGRPESDRLILVATSGDTGIAALSGYADVPHVKIAVCYPKGGVSPVQQRQMTTQPGNNLTVFEVDGDFDCCQRSVKAVLADEAFAQQLLADHGLRLSSANSINWGRLLPQIVYYLSAYADLVARGFCPPGDPVDICAPSGNFGNILAAYYAKAMGLPVGRLICASNANHVLPDFFSTGTYDISSRALVKTASPSMDILVSSNLERLLFELRRDGAWVRGLMQELSTLGVFRLERADLERLSRDFVADWVDTETCLKTIGRVFDEYGYLMDPHTAIGWEVVRRLGGDRPTIVVSTAHWSKFPGDVFRGLRGLGPEAELNADEFELVSAIEQLALGSPAPSMVRDMAHREVRFDNLVGAGAEPLENAIRGWLSGSA
jgi:threonine synthase